MNVLSSYLKKIQAEQTTTSVSAGITPYESPATGKPLIKSKVKSLTEQEIEHPKRIMVDFDGTIHRYSRGYFNGQIYDVPADEVKESLQFLKNEGFEIVIYTTRVSQTEHPETYRSNAQAIRNWLDRYGIPFNTITAEKLLGMIYIDDNGFRFSTWKDTMQFLKMLKFF